MLQCTVHRFIIVMLQYIIYRFMVFVPQYIRFIGLLLLFYGILFICLLLLYYGIYCLYVCYCYTTVYCLYVDYCYVTVYDVSGAASDRMCVVLNDIHIDIMDYILPASCSDAEFRQMWAEFEWENKVCGHNLPAHTYCRFL